MEKYLESTKENLNELNIHQLIAVSFNLSLKMNEDDIYTDSYYAEIVEFDAKDLKRFERLFLIAIHHKAAIPDNEFFEFKRRLMTSPKLAPSTMAPAAVLFQSTPAPLLPTLEEMLKAGKLIEAYGSEAELYEKRQYLEFSDQKSFDAALTTLREQAYQEGNPGEADFDFRLAQDNTIQIKGRIKFDQNNKIHIDPIAPTITRGAIFGVRNFYSFN